MLGGVLFASGREIGSIEYANDPVGQGKGAPRGRHKERGRRPGVGRRPERHRRAASHKTDEARRGARPARRRALRRGRARLARRRLEKAKASGVKSDVDEAQALVDKISRPWKAVVVGTPDGGRPLINAWVTALCPRTVFVTEALVEELDPTPDGLALCIGHELGHLLCGHTEDRIYLKAMLAYAELILLAFLDPTGLLTLLGAMGFQNSAELFLAKNSRENEVEADATGPDDRCSRLLRRAARHALHAQAQRGDGLAADVVVGDAPGDRGPLRRPAAEFAGRARETPSRSRSHCTAVGKAMLPAARGRLGDVLFVLICALSIFRTDSDTAAAGPWLPATAAPCNGPSRRQQRRPTSRPPDAAWSGDGHLAGDEQRRFTPSRSDLRRWTSDALFFCDGQRRPRAAFSSVARSTVRTFSSSNSPATSTWPSSQAMYSGVQPFLSARLTSASLSSNSRAASTWPLQQATPDRQRRPTVLLRRIDLRAVVQQQSRRVDVALLAGDVQRRPAVLHVPDDRHRRAFVQQQLRRVDVAVLAGDVQRRRAVLIRPIDLRAVVQQEPHRVDVALHAGVNPYSGVST